MSKTPSILGSRFPAIAVCALLLAACGQKGSLYLPAPAPQAPAAPASAPAR